MNPTEEQKRQARNENIRECAKIFGASVSMMMFFVLLAIAAMLDGVA